TVACASVSKKIGGHRGAATHVRRDVWRSAHGRSRGRLRRAELCRVRLRFRCCHARERSRGDLVWLLTLAIATINAWNHLSIAARLTPGTYQPAPGEPGAVGAPGVTGLAS